MKRKYGFTLIELLVTIGILSILVVGLMVAINPAEQFKKSRDAKRMQELKQIQNALELYYEDYGRYPAASSTSGNRNKIIDARTNAIVDWGATTWNQYIRTLPKDPSSGKTYAYWADASGQTYALYASFDRPENTCENNQTTECTSAVSRLGGARACGDYCNYGVTSPNTSP